MEELPKGGKQEEMEIHDNYGSKDEIDISDDINNHPVCFRTRRRLKKCRTDQDIGHENTRKEHILDDEILFTDAEYDIRRKYDQDDFIVPDDDEPIGPTVKNYTLRELLESDDAECPFPKVYTKRPSVPTPPRNMVPFRFPSEIFSILGEEYTKFAEQDKDAKIRFEDFVNVPRSEWGESEYYKRLYNYVILNAMTMGRASRETSNKKLLSMIISNRICFNEEVPMEAIHDRCDGCGTSHRMLSYIFFTFDENGIQEGILKMGSFCGQKTCDVIMIYRLLNTTPFIPEDKKEWFKNVQTLINYWSNHLLEVISNLVWRDVEDEEKDAEDI